MWRKCSTLSDIWYISARCYFPTYKFFLVSRLLPIPINKWLLSYDLFILEEERQLFVNDITLSWREVEVGEPEKMENINYRQSKRGNIERESLMISGWLSAGWTVQLWLSRLGTGLTLTHQELANKWISTSRTAGRQDGTNNKVWPCHRQGSYPPD